MSDANSETIVQQSPPQNGKERSKSIEEKELPSEPAIVCKDINVSFIRTGPFLFVILK